MCRDRLGLILLRELRLPLPGWKLSVFVRFRPPPAAAPRMNSASHPYHVTLISTKPLFQLIFSINLVFNILDTSINSLAALIFQKVRENIRVMAAILSDILNIRNTAQ